MRNICLCLLAICAFSLCNAIGVSIERSASHRVAAAAMHMAEADAMKERHRQEALEDMKVFTVEERFRRERAASKQEFDTANVAHDIHCNCPASLRQSPALCASVKKQCKSSFCSPLCTKTAWTPRIEVHCDRAPTWKWCTRFEEEVKAAEKAVTVQFQAHTCLQHKFCNRTEEFVDWIENNTYGSDYPNHKLPIPVCKAVDEDPKLKSLPASSKEQMKAQLCSACEKVVDVNIQRGNCQSSSGGPVFDVLQPGSLEGRCHYLADRIGEHARPLLMEFKSQVCTCLGCCGDGQCYFPNVEKQWLSSLIENVGKRVSQELRLDGWTFREL